MSFTVRELFPVDEIREKLIVNDQERYLLSLSEENRFRVRRFELG